MLSEGNLFQKEGQKLCTVLVKKEIMVTPNSESKEWTFYPYNTEGSF